MLDAAGLFRHRALFTGHCLLNNSTSVLKNSMEATRVAVANKITQWLCLALIGAGALQQTARAEDACAADLLARLADQALSYQVEWKGLSLESSRRLRQLDDGRWEAYNRSSLLFMSIEERSRFTLEDGRIRSLDYLYDRQGMSDKRDLRLEFAPGYYQVFSPRGDGRLDVPSPGV